MPDPPPGAPRFAVVRAPSGLGLRAAGVEGLGNALLGGGLAEALDARTATTVAPLPASGVRDPASGVLNGPEVVAYAVSLADALGTVLDAGDVPLVLGGDCSVLLGGTLALRRRDRAGLLFLDGHADFYQPSAESWGEAASMDLALVTGHGPPTVGDIEGRSAPRPRRGCGHRRLPRRGGTGPRRQPATTRRASRARPRHGPRGRRAGGRRARPRPPDPTRRSRPLLGPR